MTITATSEATGSMWTIKEERDGDVEHTSLVAPDGSVVFKAEINTLEQDCNGFFVDKERLLAALNHEAN